MSTPDPALIASWATDSDMFSLHDCHDGTVVIRIGTRDGIGADTISIPREVAWKIGAALVRWGAKT
jgi:hypothetical protein